LKDPEALNRLLHPAANRAGRRPSLDPSEELLILQRLKVTAERGFATDASTLKAIIASVVAKKGIRGIKNGIPSDDYIRSFRARNRDITFRNYEKRELAKKLDENMDHVLS